MSYACRAIGTFLAISVLALPTMAAPVTYQFQATVRPLPRFNDDVGLPFTLEEGSVIDGWLTIDVSLDEPDRFSTSASVQPHSIALKYQGFSFGAEMYSTQVVNDGSTFDNPIFDEADFIRLSCHNTSVIAPDCTTEPVAFPGRSPLASFAITATFAGEVSLLDAPELPVDIETWNGFQFERWMRISFQAAPGISAIYDTTVSQFTAIPETTTYYSALIGIVMLMNCRRKT